MLRSALEWLSSKQHCAKLRLQCRNSHIGHFDDNTKNSFPALHRLGHDLSIATCSWGLEGRCTFLHFQVAHFHPRVSIACQHSALGIPTDYSSPHQLRRPAKHHAPIQLTTATYQTLNESSCVASPGETFQERLGLHDLYWVEVQIDMALKTCRSPCIWVPKMFKRGNSCFHSTARTVALFIISRK